MSKKEFEIPWFWIIMIFIFFGGTIKGCWRSCRIQMTSDPIERRLIQIEMDDDLSAEEKAQLKAEALGKPKKTKKDMGSGVTIRVGPKPEVAVEQTPQPDPPAAADPSPAEGWKKEDW
jgi:hypothetical protein